MKLTDCPYVEFGSVEDTCTTAARSRSAETVNVPSDPRGTGLPERSVTGAPPSVTVYVPLSVDVQAPPGGVIWYVTTNDCASP